MSAANLKAAPLAAGLTQAEFAEKSGVTQPHVSQLESAAWEVRLTTIVALAEALGVQPTALLPPVDLNSGSTDTK